MGEVLVSYVGFGCVTMRILSKNEAPTLSF